MTVSPHILVVDDDREIGRLAARFLGTHGCRVSVAGSGREMDRALEAMVWSHGGVTNWYKNKRGRVVLNSPWRLVDYRNMTEHLDSADYILESA